MKKIREEIRERIREGIRGRLCYNCITGRGFGLSPGRCILLKLGFGLWAQAQLIGGAEMGPWTVRLQGPGALGVTPDEKMGLRISPFEFWSCGGVVGSVRESGVSWRESRGKLDEKLGEIWGKPGQFQVFLQLFAQLPPQHPSSLAPQPPHPPPAAPKASSQLPPTSPRPPPPQPSPYFPQLTQASYSFPTTAPQRR